MNYCYRCLPRKERIIRERRAKCILRGAHHPMGDEIAHQSCTKRFLQRCMTCGTLVVHV